MAISKKGMGRRKIEIQKIENESYLQVAFSKRRAGLFKKASELATLCGAELVVVVFSPAGKPFSYGHPLVDSVVDRYLSNTMMPEDAALQLLDFHRSATVRELGEKYNELMEQMDAQKKRGEEMKKLVAAVAGDGSVSSHNNNNNSNNDDNDDNTDDDDNNNRSNNNVSDVNDKFEMIEELNMEELEEMKGLMEDLQKKMCKRFDEIMSTQPPTMPHLTMRAGNTMINPFVAQAHRHHHHHHQANALGFLGEHHYGFNHAQGFHY